MTKLIRLSDQNPTQQELEVYELVLDITGRYNIDPSSSVEAENFFVDLLASYEGNLEDIADWLDQQIRLDFKVIDKWPKWIQNSDWVYIEGKPAVFIGQIDLSVANNNLASQIFHDDVSFYVFIGEEGIKTVIMQQF